MSEHSGNHGPGWLVTRRGLLRTLALAPLAGWLAPRKRRRSVYQATYPATY